MSSHYELDFLEGHAQPYQLVDFSCKSVGNRFEVAGVFVSVSGKCGFSNFCLFFVRIFSSFFALVCTWIGVVSVIVHRCHFFRHILDRSSVVVVVIIQTHFLFLVRHSCFFDLVCPRLISVWWCWVGYWTGLASPLVPDVSIEGVTGSSTFVSSRCIALSCSWRVSSCPLNYFPLRTSACSFVSVVVSTGINTISYSVLLLAVRRVERKEKWDPHSFGGSPGSNCRCSLGCWFDFFVRLPEASGFAWKLYKVFS